MATVDHSRKQILAKVVWYGTSGSGKTSSLQHIRETTSSPAERRKPLDTRAAGPEGVYEHYTLTVSEQRGYRTRLGIFTVPGAPRFAEARRVILEGVDAVVFVADARPDRQQANKAALDELRTHLDSYDVPLERLGFVVQCTFIDAPDALPVADVVTPLLADRADAAAIPVVGTVPVRGQGVLDTAHQVARQILKLVPPG
ncbi:uncharacterized protein CMC5_064280 [Chondromyces crocatus]|uniref:Gliding-motility protein MglA n=1 Tax=Chondromyces crocatus TaxID=52 RepID=A0A0K1EMT1_CHOCO|nr:uncharacterized protein CMC5_064280 [Chondromyces crocatus]